MLFYIEILLFEVQKEDKLEVGSDEMQVKKEELKLMILNTARNEFLHRGYEDASLRTIAKKANTTIGNIYHYYPNKEAILDEILAPAIKEMEELIRDHLEESVAVTGVEEIDEILDELDLNDTEAHILLSPEFVIFMRTKVEKYVVYREAFKEKLVHHIAWHLNVEVNHFVILVMDMVIECLIHLNTTTHDIKEKQRDFIDLFRMLCSGIIVSDGLKKKK